MGVSLYITLFLVWVCVVWAEWFPPLEVADSAWQEALSNFDVSGSYKTCGNEFKSGPGGENKFITLYKEKPMTFVVVGRGGGNMDIKFKDSNYVFEHKFELSADKYLVIPPYQPVEWILIRTGESFKLCSYSETVDSTVGSHNYAGECDCAEEVAQAEVFTSVTFPRTIRKPEQQFFLTADVTPDANDVTICTILTVDRLLRLSQMSAMWGGPISAAVFLHDLSEIAKVMEWYLANNTLRRHVDIHLVQDDKIVAFELPDRAFPVNILRNVAIRFARTANVFYIEGDFIPSPDLYPNLGEVRKRLATGEKSVFIVAPFSTDNNDFDMAMFPKNKQALVDMLDKAIRDLSYFNSHAPFKFREWYKSTQIYGMAFTGGYEPYYIGPKNFPLFEEIFIGCGADKVSHPSELNSAGYHFQVLPEGFIVHIDSTAIAPQADEPEVCDAPPPPAAKECPACECDKCEECAVCPNAGCPPPSKADCSRFIDSYSADLASVNSKLEKSEDLNSKHKAEIASMEAKVRAMAAENERLLEYSKFVVNLGIGVVVVMAVVVGLGVCIWPRSKKVWVLPTWKSTHHNL